MDHQYDPEAFLLDIECECCRKKMVEECDVSEYVDHPRAPEIIKEMSLHNVRQTTIFCMHISASKRKNLLVRLVYDTLKANDTAFFRILFEECGTITRETRPFQEFVFGRKLKNTDYLIQFSASILNAAIYSRNVEAVKILLPLVTLQSKKLAYHIKLTRQFDAETGPQAADILEIITRELDEPHAYHTYCMRMMRYVQRK